MSAAAVAGAVSLLTAPAMAYSAKVRQACAGDYQSFCSQYAPDSTELRRCFESNRKGLTRTCKTALVDAGEVPARYLKKR
ncbi:hypothetical protein HYPDE_27788 [Hyphomicrobium denitrificans 1NES1]|uniref:3',5'-cyclic-nucleotide phosphodiesterase n=1 Tax=Hyphomicrobium denitrificans 1NES1 TaxID=670307 RepID=N0B4T0_9HYPH|nr:hypothetical protein HYPDE_27788 [Hyphomicrobium denitrificans 1NES1]